jgi:hypothetical protein
VQKLQFIKRGQGSAGMIIRKSKYLTIIYIFLLLLTNLACSRTPRLVDCRGVFKKRSYAYSWNWKGTFTRLGHQKEKGQDVSIIGWNRDDDGVKKYLVEREYWYDPENIKLSESCVGLTEYSD